MAARRKILEKLDIKPTDWVLEIGGGQAPFERSDILADKFIDENKERAADIIIDRPLVVCDAHYLPFVDNAFDYVFCSQVLEHLENPELFFKEISRVSKKGYIETPNEIRERLFGWPFHKWIVDKDEHGLVLRENNLEQAFGLFFHKLQLDNYEFSQFCIQYHDLLNVCYEWHGKPTYRFAEKEEYNLPKEKVWIEEKDILRLDLKPYNTGLSIGSVLNMIKKKTPKWFKDFVRQYSGSPPYGNRHSQEKAESYLKEISACPYCKKRVERENNICSACQKKYEIKNDIPFML